MDQITLDLLTFTGKASLLEEKIIKSHTQKQLFDIAQEAAKFYHVLSNRLMIKENDDREQLAKLSKRFSWIENEAIRKFYGNRVVGPKLSII